MSSVISMQDSVISMQDSVIRMRDSVIRMRDFVISMQDSVIRMRDSVISIEDFIVHSLRLCHTAYGTPLRYSIHYRKIWLHETAQKQLNLRQDILW